MFIKPVTGIIPCLAVKVQRNIVVGWLNMHDAVKHCYLVALILLSFIVYIFNDLIDIIHG